MTNYFKKYIIFSLCTSLNTTFTMLTILALCTTSGCISTENVLQGSSIAASKTISCANVNKIKVSGTGTLIITQDKERDENLTIEADDNILPHILTEVSDNILEIKTKNNVQIKPSTPLVYRVTTKEITKIDMFGSITTEIPQLKTNALDITSLGNTKITAQVDVKKITINTSGLNNLTFAGKADMQDITITGSGFFNGENLKGKESSIYASGATQVNVNVSDVINGTITGASIMRYTNNPAIKITTSGAATLKKEQPHETTNNFIHCNKS